MLINVEGKRKQTDILNLKYYYKPNTKLWLNSKVKMLWKPLFITFSTHY